VDADGSTVLGVLYTTWEWEKNTWTPKDVQLENSDTHEENKLNRAKINANAQQVNGICIARVMSKKV
jgi:hypothetical protein